MTGIAAALPKTEPRLLESLRTTGAIEPWLTFVQVYGPAFRIYCANRGLDSHGTEEVWQIVLLKVRRFEYEPQRGPFRHWFARVAKREVNRLLRGKHSDCGKWDDVVDPPDPTSCDPDWDRLYRAQVLHHAVERIRPSYDLQAWSIIEAIALARGAADEGPYWVWVEDSPYAEVSRTFGIDLQRLYALKYRFYQRLKQEVLDLAETLGLLD